MPTWQTKQISFFPLSLSLSGPHRIETKKKTKHEATAAHRDHRRMQVEPGITSKATKQNDLAVLKRATSAIKEHDPGAATDGNKRCKRQPTPPVHVASASATERSEDEALARDLRQRYGAFCDEDRQPLRRMFAALVRKHFPTAEQYTFSLQHDALKVRFSLGCDIGERRGGIRRRLYYIHIGNQGYDGSNIDDDSFIADCYGALDAYLADEENPKNLE